MRAVTYSPQCLNIQQKQLIKLALSDKTKKYDAVFLFDMASLYERARKRTRATATVGEIEHGRLCDQ